MKNEMLNEIIKESIEIKINNLDFEGIAYQVLKDKIERQFKPICNKYCEEKIGQEINRIMQEPIEIDDGWHPSKHYDSFELLFKEIFKKKLEEDWNIKSEIKRVIEEKVNNLVKEKAKELTAKIQDLIFEETIGRK